MSVVGGAGDILSRVGVNLDWSNPLAETLDEVIRGVIKQFGLEDELEKVSGDNERLRETAADWRKAARDLRGVVDDLQAERRKVEKAWAGEAAESFRSQLTKYENALSGEADDLDTVATLLDTAAEECAMAEQLMIELIVEIIETVIAAAATTAILSLLTAGAAAAIGPIITAAGVANKVLRAAKITAKLADRLSDLAQRLKAIKRAEKLAGELKKLGGGKKMNESYRNGLKRYRGKLETDGMPAGQREDLMQYAAWRATKKGINKGLVSPVVGNDVGEPIGGLMTEFDPDSAAKEQTAYDRRPPSQTFDQRMAGPESPTKQSIRETFG